ncbi:MAG: hypothetical protein K0Q81_415 [Paenibacillus sp.]|nr:hypothetical protein [Paenibacillus sp.]
MSTGNKGLAFKVSSFIFTVMALFAVVVLVIGFYMNERITDTREKLEQELSDQVQIEQLRNHAQTNVSDMRAFLAYGRDEFLEEFNVQVKVFAINLNSFKSYISGLGASETQKYKLLEEISVIWEQYVKFTQKSVELKKSEEIEELATFSQYTSDAIKNMDNKFNEMLEIQDTQVDKLLNDNRRDTGFLIYMPIFIVVGCLIAGLFLVRYLRGNVIQPLIEVGQSVNEIAEGNYNVELADKGRTDELGRLMKGITFMSRELHHRRDQLEQSNMELIGQRDLLEAQNEEITAQQNEQEAMLEKLTDRERELEFINSYQEKLTGYAELSAFMEHSVRALLQALHMDAAVLVAPRSHNGTYEVIHAYGYPTGYLPASYEELFGVSQRAMIEKRAITRIRKLSERERGIHGGYETATDIYYPLLDDQSELLALLLLTSYEQSRGSETMGRLTTGLVRQFSLAYMAQIVNEDRRKQAELLEELNEELSQEKEGLQEQRDFVRQIVESVHEGMVMCDSDGRVKFTNGWMHETFGVEETHDFTIQHIFQVLLTKVKSRGESILLLIESVLSGQLDVLEEKFTILNDEGRECHYELYVNVVADGEDHGKSFLFVFRDRTDEEIADEVKNEFISIVSHELRTPLASILGFMEILLHRDIQKDKQRKYMETIYKEANRLSSLINDFLDLQRMESGKQSYQLIPVDVVTVLKDVMEQWQGKQDHQIHIHVPESGTAFVLADYDKMTQVFHNLISNAVKYSPGADRIDLRIVQQGKQVVIQIQDYGLGIPEEARDKLFSKFYRVDNSDRRQIGGTGLGLSIVKEIVESHKGSLTYDSVLGQGTTFQVFMDSYVANKVDNSIMIVEDDENLAKLITVSFEKLQLPTVHMKTAEAAIFSLNQSSARPLLCIVDIQLDGQKSGWDFVTELLKRPLYENTPIIVSTVLEQPKHFHETDTEKFLKKPFSVERLLELAEQLIAQGKERGAVVFPMQNEQSLATSLEQMGIHVKEMKMKKDIIEVEVNNDERGS